MSRAVTYTLHLPADAPAGEADSLERAVLVRDGFSWGAFLFNALWFVWHRLWLAALLILLGEIALIVLLTTLKVGSGTGFLAQFLVSLLVGLEASSLQRWTLARRGRPAVDAVSAGGLEEAEAKSFARWLDGTRRAVPANPSASFAMPYRAEPVIGLFPDAERRR